MSDRKWSNHTRCEQVGEAFADILDRRLSRRTFVRGSLLTTTGLLLAQPGWSLHARQDLADGFIELSHGRDADFHVAPGYHHRVLLRWGDALFPDSPVFKPRQLEPSGQSRQFGYNNDFLAYMPLPAGSGNSRQGLLVVNHEYTDRDLMFAVDHELSRRERIDIEIAAHGLSVVAIERTGLAGQYGSSL